MYEGLHFDTTEIRYTTTNQPKGKAEVTGEFIVMKGELEDLGGGRLVGLKPIAVRDERLLSAKSIHGHG